MIFLFQILAFTFLTDKIVLKKIFNLNSELVRWYILHAILNGLICCYCIKPIYSFIFDPIFHIQNPIHYFPTNVICSMLHLYHIIFFKCTPDDIFHHLGFVLIGGILLYVYNYGYMLALYHFFLCGFPGGIDYIFLALVKLNYLSKDTRLKTAVTLNNWIRVPGGIVSWSYVILFFTYSEKTIIDIAAFIIGTFCSVYNVLYYNEKVLIAAGKMRANKKKIKII